MTELEQTETESPEQTEAFGGYLAEKYPEKRVIALLGGLGAGKTALTRGIARRLGCLDQASSPTYAIVNEYRGPRPVCHFDMYRIQGGDALYVMDQISDNKNKDYLESGALCVVEWSENILEALPPDTLFVKLEILSPERRRIIVTEGGILC